MFQRFPMLSCRNRPVIFDLGIVYQNPTEGELPVEMSRLGPKEYFGAKSLFFNQKPGASVKAHGPLTCVKMKKEHFESEVAPVLLFLKNKAEQYISFFDLFV